MAPIEFIVLSAIGGAAVIVIAFCIGYLAGWSKSRGIHGSSRAYARIRG